jgi:oxygen-dependent protoporphyrinogen oxidase
MLPLVRITAFYADQTSPHPGRGVLFPPNAGIRALGVLFSSNIFPDREAQYSESWIYGGAGDRDVVHMAEDDLAATMDRDRHVAFGRSEAPEARLVHRWRAALPHYDLQLESVRAAGFNLPKGLFLGGNYVGGIGVTTLLEQAAALAGRVGEMA